MMLIRIGDNYVNLGGTITASGLWVPGTAPEPPSEWPGPTNTGAASGLPTRGTWWTTAPGQTLRDVKVIGQIQILHDNTTIDNVEVDATGYRWGIDGHYDVPHSYLKVLNSTVYGCYGSGVLTGEWAEVDKCNFHTTTEGVMIGGGNFKITSNWMHDQWSDDADPHFDNIQAGGGWQNGLIQGNRLEGQDTSNILAQGEFGPFTGLKIIGNYLDLTRVAASFAYIRGWNPGEVAYAEFTDNVLVGTAWNAVLDLTNGPLEFIYARNVNSRGELVTNYNAPLING